jgi:hypothetical protein
MGTAIYGSYDELVFELSMGDRLRNVMPPKKVRVKLDDVVHVRAADPAHLVSWDGERVLRIGRARDGRKVVVLELAGRSCGYDRIVVTVDDADDAVAGLRRSGIGRGAPVAA